VGTELTNCSDSIFLSSCLSVLISPVVVGMFVFFELFASFIGLFILFSLLLLISEEFVLLELVLFPLYLFSFPSCLIVEFFDIGLFAEVFSISFDTFFSLLLFMLFSFFFAVLFKDECGRKGGRPKKIFGIFSCFGSEGSSENVDKFSQTLIKGLKGGTKFGSFANSSER
jgi:hypothetical protein